MPKQLIDYVRDAQKLGLQETEIRRNAMRAGWDKQMIDEAISMLSNSGMSFTKADAAESPGPGAGVPTVYRIGAGDVLEITVWKEPDASVPQVVVRSDGKISMPLIKEVYVVGLTPKELEKQLTRKLSDYIHDPDVTVVVKEVHSAKVYIMGAVKTQGPIDMTSSMTVLQAINKAGGLTEFAKTKKIYVLRNVNGKPVRLPFDYNAVIKGEDMDQNIYVLPGDSIVVP